MNSRRRAWEWPRLTSALVALGLLVALRLPTNIVPILNVDEADFAVDAGVLLDGGRPYIDFVEKKPPLVYAIYAGALALLGRHNLQGFRLLLIGYVLACALVIGAIARRLHGETAALLSVPLYALAVSLGPPANFHAANPETLFSLPLLLGTLLCLPPRGVPVGTSGRFFSAGCLIGAASLIKQQAGMQLPILLVFLWWPPSSSASWVNELHLKWKKLTRLVAGFLATWLVALAALAAVGSLGEFYYWTVDINRYYIAHGNNFLDALAVLRGAAQTLWAFAPVLWLLGLAQLALTIIRRRPEGRLEVLWFLGSCVPVALGGRYFLHYFLQLFPPLVLFASTLLSELWERGAVHRVARASLVLAVLLPTVWVAARRMPVFFNPEVLSIPHATPAARELALYIREHTKPDDRILVWGYGSAIYFLSERRPATRFPYVTYLVGAVEGTPAWWSPFHPSRGLEIPRAWELFFSDLERNPPTLIVDTSRNGYFAFSKFPPRKYPRLSAYLSAGFQETEVAGFPIWRPKE